MAATAEYIETDSPIEQVSELHPLTRDEVKGIVSNEIQRALGAMGSEISGQRAKAIQYYYGKPFGNETEGRSSVILTDVADTIEWAMPNLMQMLIPGNTVARYDYRDEEQSDQATEYCNHVYMEENNGYLLSYETFKTGLLEKTGWMRVYIDERTEPKVDTYVGLTDAELDILLARDDGEPIERDERMEPGPINPETGEPTMIRLHDVKLRQTRTSKRIRIDSIAPEEMLVPRAMVELDDDCRFLAHRRRVLISDLIASGYDPDVVLNLPNEDPIQYQEGRIERFEDEEYGDFELTERADPASRDIWITDCFIRIDEDGDGYSELRNIVVAGEDALEILSDEEVNFMPFAYFCPVPVPHKLIGLSLADLLMDLQLIRSTILRQSLDNMYITNNSRVVAVEGQVNMDDLMVSRPGGIVRARAPGMVEPLAIKPFGPMAFNMLEFTEGIKENRTGITRYSQGQDGQSLNKTATGVSKIMSASFARIGSVATLYAKVGLKRLFKLILRTAVEGGFKREMIRFRGEWVTVDPSTWNAEMDVKVQVGLGLGQENERASYLQQIIQLQGEAAARGFGGYLVEPEHFFNAVSDLTRTIGMENAERYFADPALKGPPPPPPPDPKIEVEKQKVQIDGQRLELDKQKHQTETAAEAALAEFRHAELASNERIALAQMDADETLKQAEMELKKEEIAAKERIEREKLEAQREAARLQAEAAKAAGTQEKTNGGSEK